jgi:hypothetical protein
MRDLNYLKRGVECIKIQESRPDPQDYNKPINDYMI